MPRTTAPILPAPADAVDLLLTLAESKAATDRATRSIAALTGQIAALAGQRTREWDISPTTRLRMDYTPPTVTRRAKTGAREALLRRRPELAAEVVSTVHPSRPNTVTFTRSPGWTPLLDRYAGEITLDGPVTAATVPAAWKLIAQAREFLADAKRDDAELRDDLADVLTASGVLDSAASVKLDVPGGGLFAARTTAPTQRLNTAALEQIDPALFLELTQEKTMPERWTPRVVDLTAAAESGTGL